MQVSIFNLLQIKTKKNGNFDSRGFYLVKFFIFFDE